MLEGNRFAGEFNIPAAFDFVALILFAITGALTAAKRDYDWVGIAAIALVTGAGGGLLRDILLNVRPALLEDEAYLWAVIIGVILSVFFCRVLIRMRYLFNIADALGLAIYAVYGTQKSLLGGLNISAAVLVGTLNAIGGGLIRDILTQQEVGLFKPGQWHAIIAFGACLAFALLVRFTLVPPAAAGLAVVIIAVIVKFLALRFDFRTRAIKPRGFVSTEW